MITKKEFYIVKVGRKYGEAEFWFESIEKASAFFATLVGYKMPRIHTVAGKGESKRVIHFFGNQQMTVEMERKEVEFASSEKEAKFELFGEDDKDVIVD